MLMLAGCPMAGDMHLKHLYQELQSDDCRSVAEAAAVLAAAGEHPEPWILERAKHCLIPRHGGRRRIDFARAYFHLLNPADGGREAERLLRSGSDPEIRTEAFHALIEYGAEALPVIRSLVVSRDSMARWYAYRAAARIGDDETIPTLLRGLEDADVGPRQVAANALIDRQAEAFVPLLRAIATRPPVRTFHLACWTVLRRITPEGWREQAAPLLRSLVSPWGVYESGFMARAILNALLREPHRSRSSRNSTEGA